MHIVYIMSIMNNLFNFISSPFQTLLSAQVLAHWQISASNKVILILISMLFQIKQMTVIQF